MRPRDPSAPDWFNRLLWVGGIVAVSWLLVLMGTSCVKAKEVGVLTFGSLFAGCGGMDLGLERAGMRCVWQVEINEFARRVLAKHWPDVTRHDDVRTFPTYYTERVDVIAGGFPCKQTSTAAAVHGKRVGLAGQDSGLWREMFRVVCRLRPRIVIVENPQSKWLAQVKADLESIGYEVSGVPLTAAGVSAAGSIEGRATDRDAWLSTLPGVLRVDDGVPGGVDRRERITAVGNAVVPQVAEWIGRRIVEAAHV